MIKDHDSWSGDLAGDEILIEMKPKPEPTGGPKPEPTGKPDPKPDPTDKPVTKPKPKPQPRPKPTRKPQPAKKTKKVKLNMRLKMKQKFNPKLTDRDSDEFKALEAKILNKFKAGFEKIAADKGMTVDLSVSFEEVAASRKRRDASAGDTKAIIDATYSSTDESTDLSAMESDLSGSVQASVAAAVKTTDGGDDLIDETASIEVQIMFLFIFEK